VSEPTDVIVLGGGPAGYACALRCSDLGLSATVVEERELGGTCLHRGCVPTRATLQAASIANSAGKPAEHWGVLSKFDGMDMARMRSARDDIVKRNHHAVEGHLMRAGVKVAQGLGFVRGPRDVQVGNSLLQANKALVISTGSAPRVLKRLVPDGKRVLDSDQTLEIESVPRSVAIVGGGAIGAEFSQIWSSFGAEVTLIERAPNLVPTEDEDVGRTLERALRRHGVKIVVEARFADVAHRPDGVELRLTTPTGDRSIAVELVIVAAGRLPSTGGFGLEETGVTTTDGFIVPADWDSLETNVPGVYAAGDLLPLPSQARAHVAYAEGMLVAERIAGERGPGLDYQGIPRVTHGLVETACVGLSEREARAAGADVEVMSFPIGGVAKGLMLGEAGMAKVVAERGGSVLGIHLVGPQVAELIAEAAAIVDFEATPEDVASLIHPHPTLSEILGEMHMALAGRPLHFRVS
jgi:dihydrolipoamide dehydrogenase